MSLLVTSAAALIYLSGGAYLSNWVCVWSQRRPGDLSAGAIVYGRSRREL